MDVVPTVAGHVAQMHTSMTAEPPDEVMAAFGREQAALAAEGLPDGIAVPGTMVPDADLLAPLTERSIGLVAISPQAPDGSLSMQQKHDLGFTAVSDPGNVIAGALGVLTRPSDEARAAQLHLGLDLTTVNADGSIALPMPTVAITDTAHALRWIDVHPDYSTRTEPARILAAIDRFSL
jgi:hypothetical protein